MLFYSQHSQQKRSKKEAGLKDTLGIGINEFLRNFPLRKFRPVCFYFRHIDQMFFVTCDCSVVEERVNDLLCLMEKNHPPNEGRVIGFSIARFKTFCSRNRFPVPGKIMIGNVLDAVLEEFPDSRDTVETVLRPLVGESGIEFVKM